jgi:hypothetical protein
MRSSSLQSQIDVLRSLTEEAGTVILIYQVNDMGQTRR